MMDIIERAARALCEQGGFDPAEIMANDGPRWKYYVPTVRTVLIAIREPSDVMIATAMDAGFGPDVAKRAYKAMIDGALR